LNEKYVEFEKFKNKSNEQIQTLNAILQTKTTEINRLKDEVKNNLKEIRILQYNNHHLKDVRKKENTNILEKNKKLQDQIMRH